MRIVRLRARAVLALAICVVCALAVMKALSDSMTAMDEVASVEGGREPGEQRGKKQTTNVDRHGRRAKGEKTVHDEALLGDRAAPAVKPAIVPEQRKAFEDLRPLVVKNSEGKGSVERGKQPPPESKQQHQPLPPAVPRNGPVPDSGSKTKIDRNAERNSLNRHELSPFDNNGRLRVDGAAAAQVGAYPFRPNRHESDSLKVTPNTTGYPQLVNGKFVPGRRIVHLDLKGAAPKLHYFEKFFQMISKLGATGILIEWEDTFPYTGELLECRSGRAYSESDVRTILGWAKANNLEVIPLVQTFGHLEWILKHPKFAHLREVERYAQVICPSNPDAVRIVKLAIDQVMSIHHPLDGGEFFHMGADEAFQIGMCDRCVKAIREQFNNNREKLMVKHITTIAEYIKQKYNRRVLMWHDMLNNVDGQMMREARMGQLVEPVVWAYAENLNDYLLPDMWQRFAQTFPYIWAASAYKGADGPSRFYSNIPHYLQNHVSWGQQMSREYRNFREFRGIILTGWQRFDHFAVLCELLPVGVPSLAVNLQIMLTGGDYNRKVVSDTAGILGCNSLDVDSPGVAGYCQFPGNRIYQYVQQLKMSQQNMKQTLLEDYQLRGWLSPFNMAHNYSSAWYLDQIVDKVQMSLNDLQSLSRALRAELSKVFEEDTVDEFLMEYLEPDLEYLQKLYDSAKRIGQVKTFPVRPFPIQGVAKPTTTRSSPPNQQQQSHERNGQPDTKAGGL